MTSTIKVDNIQNQSGDNIIKEDSNTITLGASGDTISLAAGASQTGFGREGSVDWQTGSIKTATFTAANGEGYFANTTGGAFTMNLPSSPSAGNIVAVKDYAQTFQTNNLTVGRGGSNIEGVAGDITLDGTAESITLVYVDSTKGWVLVSESLTNYGAAFVAATGGTISTCGNFKVHTFTSPGCFTVTCAGNSAGSNSVDYLVVAGGGGGGAGCGGGGGAGGFRVSNSVGCIPAPTTSPLVGPAALPVSAQTYPVTVGGGGVGRQFPPGGDGGNGSNAAFSTITSTGGGGGGGPGQNGANGGSGGGRGPGNCAGNGNTPPVSPPQGFPGRPAGPNGSGGGGAGGSNPQPSGGGGVDGSFVSPLFAGSNGTTGPVGSVRYFAGGGSGNEKGAGGAGGGGASNPSGSGPVACAGSTNTGGGGGAWNGNPPGAGAGGSGIVIIRYKFQQVI